MSSVIKINACVYSRKGYERESNTNSFYMNGKFTSEEHIDNLQASMENRGTEYLFSLADNMDCSDDDNDTHISIIKEISRYHEKITVNGGDVKFKIKELETKISDISRLITSILEMNRVPAEDPRRGIGFGGILISDGQFVAATAGNCRIFMMRDGMFRPLAAETSRAKRMLDALIRSDETVEDGDVTLPDEDPDSLVVVSDIYDVAEGDSFLICSDGLIQALGEEKIEDILSLRSDSAYIASRMVEEAMKRSSSGDLTAMVVQVERRYEGSPSRRTTARSKQVKNRVERLNKAPAITYKYNRKRGGRYQGTLYVVLVLVTLAVLFGIIYIIINSMINTGRETTKPDPEPTVTVTPTSTPVSTPDPVITPEPTEEPSLAETPTPDPSSDGEIRTHTVVQGDTISKIARTYYGSSDYGAKLCEYNGISDPNKIVIGQKIKIPPKEMLP
jgi:serine/threonine protein phosphatase PrpC/LysM repeat protein